MRKQQSDPRVMKTRIKKSLHRKGPSFQLGKTWVQLHETFNKLNSPPPPVCKQNDKTKSVPGNFNLTLKLHETQTPRPLHLSGGAGLLGGGSKGKVTVQRAKRWDQDCGLDSKKHGERNLD